VRKRDSYVRQFAPQYFASAGRGVAVYTHVSALWMPFYKQVITCHVRQAPYLLDGLLQHGTRRNPREHYTDTHGYTVLIFGLTQLLGIRLAPRLKDLPDQRLLNVNLIQDSGDEMLRLVW
jgi:TnpA family transposase